MEMPEGVQLIALIKQFYAQEVGSICEDAVRCLDGHLTAYVNAYFIDCEAVAYLEIGGLRKGIDLLVPIVRLQR
jgi:hypothetical protein